MITYSTCRTCGGQMTVTTNPQYWHPTCKPSPTRLEEVLDNYRVLAEKEGPEIEDKLREIERLVDELTAAPPKLMEAALAYAAWGWPVFPLLPLGMPHPRDPSVIGDGKKPATRHGFKDATTDFALIRRWWEYMPTCNIGLPTGIAFDAIDVDPRSGGAASWMAICDKPTLPNCHGRVTTANGGFHLYVEPTGGGNRAGIYPGIDYRGVGGYVVAPPSTLDARARSWSWSVYPSPTIIPARKEAAGQ